MKSFIVNSKDLLDKKKNPHFSLSPREILKNKKIEKMFEKELKEAHKIKIKNPKWLELSKKIKPHYLTCIWCGGNMPKNKPYAKYCSEKCKREALGQKPK